MKTSDSPTDVELVYGYLLAILDHANKQNNTAMSARALTAVELLEEVWPEDTDRWNARFPADATFKEREE